MSLDLADLSLFYHELIHLSIFHLIPSYLLLSHLLASLVMFPWHKDGRTRKFYSLNAMNRTCPSKWRIKKPFITCTWAGAAKKAAGCGGEARGASLSYLEPFPVNLGPPFVVVLRACMHTLARSLQRECTHARACDGLGPLPARVCMRARIRRRIWLRKRVAARAR